MLKKLFLGVILLFALVCAYVAVTPGDFKIERSALIKAPPKVVFAHVNNLKKFQAWNAWAKIDPNAKQTFSGPELGVGAVASWEGNKDVGSGLMTITESQQDSNVKMRLEFISPFKGTSETNFSLVPQDGSTLITWTMTGRGSFIPRLMCTLMFVNMDKMMGEMFEKGLASLKEVAEQEK